MKKVLLVDPGYLDYIQGFYKACILRTNTKLVTKYWIDSNDGNIYRWFFKHTDKKEHNYFRRIERGIEYIYTYLKILRLIKREKFEVVHIHWALIPIVDCYFFRRIKSLGCRLVYTAHDVIPHVNAKKSIKQYGKLYSIPDKIIVHGKGCENEMHEFYPEVSDKLYIQYHGCYEKSLINEEVFFNYGEIVKRINSNKGRVFSFIGQIFYNKGTDRVLKYWLENNKESNDLLIVAGRVFQMYPELKNLLDETVKAKNIIYYPHYLPKSLHDYLYSSSDIIILPYRHASMSGVLFSAAQFDKTVLCTNEGSISEYIFDTNNAYLVANKKDEFENKLNYIINNVTKEQLHIQGKNFSNDIYNKCSWDVILNGVIEACYN